jgi:hypothetical protein
MRAMDAISESWFDDLIEYIKDGKVIPVVGQDVFQLSNDGETVYNRIAKKLAVGLGLSVAPTDETSTLDDLVFKYVRSGGRQGDIYARIRRIFREDFANDGFEIPEAVRKLVSIPQFDLFVSTTFDPLLETAINKVRFDGAPRTKVLSFTKSGGKDLGADKADLADPVVYHLFGNLETSLDYAINEEDILDFLCELMKDEKQPARLFDELKDNHLLLIGCSYSAWLSYFFIRVARGEKLLSFNRNWTEFYIDQKQHIHHEQIVFLERVSPATLVRSFSAVEFIDRLAERLTTTSAQVARPAGGGFEPGAIFISYAREDWAAASALNAALQKLNLPTWLDQVELQGGESWETSIRRQINSCSCFIPVISRAAVARSEGYFRTEWYWATQRSHAYAPGAPFLIPVQIDDVKPSPDTVPNEILDAHIINLSNGPTDEFCTRMNELWRDYKKRQQRS